MRSRTQAPMPVRSDQALANIRLRLAHRTCTEDGVQVGRTEDCTILSSGQAREGDLHNIATGGILD